MDNKNISYKKPGSLLHATHTKIMGHHTMSSKHYHDHYEIYYLCSGKRNYFIKDRMYAIQKGDLVLINKNDLHRTIDGGIPNHERLLLDFNESTLSAIYSDELSLLLHPFKIDKPVLRLSIPDQVTVESILTEILDEQQLQRTGYRICMQGLFYELLVQICRLIEKQHGKPMEHPSIQHQRISEIVQYINSNYEQPLHLPRIAKLFFISPYYLSSLFKKTTGFTLVEYLQLVRIKEAQKLLLSSNDKIIEIAQRVGFGSVAHFGRVFKQTVSVSPTEYRKAAKTLPNP